MNYTIAQLEENAQAIISRLENYSPFLRAIFQQMYNTGCRSIEVITPNKWSITEKGSWELISAKGSMVRTIPDEEMDKGYKNMSSLDYEGNTLFTSDTLRDKFNQFSNYAFMYVGNKKITCHLYRHLKMKAKYNELGTYEAVQEYIGHVEIANTIAYINSIITDGN